MASATIAMEEVVVERSQNFENVTSHWSLNGHGLYDDS